jgi:hypothetical protein
MFTDYENERAKDARLRETTQEVMQLAADLLKQRRRQEAGELIAAHLDLLRKERPGFETEDAFADFARFAGEVQREEAQSADRPPSSLPSLPRPDVELPRLPSPERKPVDVSPPAWTAPLPEKSNPLTAQEERKRAKAEAQLRQQRTSNFHNYFRHIVNSEGGFVNDPDDPGGATMRGVTQGTYNGYLDRHGRKRQSVRNITPDEVTQIYREGYWNVVRGDELPDDTAFVVFDAAINHGPGTAVRMLRRSLGMKADGGMTQEVIDRALQANDNQNAYQIIDARLRYYDGIIARKPKMAKYRKGWQKRMSDLRNQINQ